MFSVSAKPKIAHGRNLFKDLKGLCESKGSYYRDAGFVNVKNWLLSWQLYQENDCEKSKAMVGSTQ